MSKKKTTKPAAKLAHLPVGPILDSKDLREKEVVGALIAAARMVEQPSEVNTNLTSMQAWLDKTYDTLDDAAKADNAANCIIQLEDILARSAPPFTRFSGPDGERRSWGVWPDEQRAIEAESNGTLVRTGSKVNMAEWKKQGRQVPDWNLTIDTVGKITLYGKTKSGRGFKWTEIWSFQ